MSGICESRHWSSQCHDEGTVCVHDVRSSAINVLIHVMVLHESVLYEQEPQEQ